MQCPSCGSDQIKTKNHARRIGSAVGGAIGVACDPHMTIFRS
jgi:hypothetical protein